jgi:pyruvate carboxylase subunit B
MAKKFIDIMDTSFRDGFQSVFGGRVLMDDFFPAVEAGVEAGIKHFEFGGGARFQSLFFYLNENAFDMMDKFRSIVGDDINLQTLSRGVNTVMLDTANADLIDLHAKMFKKHGATTIRNFDALNDIRNLQYSAQCITNYGLKHEVVVTMMDLPPGCSGAHDVAFYEKTIKDILKLEIPFDSICFKDASGTSSPQKVYNTIKMARKILPENTHIRLHTHETAGMSVSCYLAGLEAGLDGIDLAISPVSGGTSQPDILTMLHAVKGKDFDLGGLEIEKILKYETVLKDCLDKYFIPAEATSVSPLIPMSPMPGGALTANTQMMRDNNTFDKFNDVILAMREVVEKGGYGTSVTPVSQFYWQQAYSNVMFGKWKKIAPGYGKMVLGYFGKTPVKPDEDIIKLASEQLNLQPTNKNPMDIANEDENKSIYYWKKQLEKNDIQITDENIFIAASCEQKGIAFLKNETSVNIRLKKDEISKSSEGNLMSGEYTVVVNGENFNVKVSEGVVSNITPNDISNNNVNDESQWVRADVSGAIFKILVKESDEVKEGDAIAILESMKMEIEVISPVNGFVINIAKDIGDSVAENDKLIQIVSK